MLALASDLLLKSRILGLVGEQQYILFKTTQFLSHLATDVEE